MLPVPMLDVFDIASFDTTVETMLGSTPLLFSFAEQSFRHLQDMFKDLCGCADNVDLGTACGKLHRVCMLAITDPGESVSSF